MKCTCGQEFEGRFCPNCGKKAENNYAFNDEENQFGADNNETQTDSEQETGGSSLVNGWNAFMDYRLTIGSFVSALFGFLLGCPATGVCLILGGIIISPQMKAKFPKSKILLNIIFWALVFIAVLLAKDVVGEN